jgi:plastocyanin
MTNLARIACIATLAALAGCGGGNGYNGGSNNPPACTAANATATTSVSASAGMQFIPSCIKVTAGATVTWTNNDAVNHTVSSDTAAEPFASGTLTPAAGTNTFQHPFNAARTVQYHCTLHGTIMSGTVIVE